MVRAFIISTTRSDNPDVAKEELEESLHLDEEYFDHLRPDNYDLRGVDTRCEEAGLYREQYDFELVCKAVEQLEGLLEQDDKRPIYLCERGRME